MKKNRVVSPQGDFISFFFFSFSFHERLDTGLCFFWRRLLDGEVEADVHGDELAGEVPEDVWDSDQLDAL